MSSPMAEPLSTGADIQRRLLKIGFAALHHRVLLFLAFGAVVGAFTWVMLDTTVLHIITAGIFTVPAMYVFYAAMSALREGARREP